MQFGDVTEDNRNITTIRDYQSRSYGSDDDIQVSIIYERDLDFHRVDREVYSILDWLGDVGGLYEALKIICGIFLSVVNFLQFENFLVSQLFKKESDDKDEDDDKKTLSRAGTQNTHLIDPDRPLDPEKQEEKDTIPLSTLDQVNG